MIHNAAPCSAFEAGFAYAQEHAFRVLVRRAHLFGRWAGASIGLADEALETYAMSFVTSDIAKRDDHVVRKVSSDFSALKIAISGHELAAKLHELTHIAELQVVRGH